MAIRSLRVKTILIAASTMALVLATFSGTFIVIERNKGANDILNGGQTFANFSASSIYENYTELYTHSQDFEPFKDRVQQVLDLNHDVVGVSLLGVNGRVLFDSSEFTKGKYNGSVRIVSDADTLNDLQSSKTVHRSLKLPDGSLGTAITVPISDSGVGHILSARYLLSYASLQRRTNDIFIETAALAIPLLALVIIVAVFFAIRLTKPLVMLTRVAEQIRDGNFTIKTGLSSQDEIGRLASSFDDMTTRLRETYGKLSEQTARLTASVESLPLGFLMTDANGATVISNPTMQKMLAVDQPSDKDTPESTDLKARLLDESKKCLQQKRPAHIPELTRLGRIYQAFLAPVLPSSSDASKTQNVPALGVVVLLEDITEARIIARSKDEFFSIASHELRTPLTAIKGNTSMMLEFYAKAFKDPQLKDMVDDIHTSSVRLIEIVNDFLDTSRLEQGKIQFKLQSFPIGQIISQVQYEMSTVLKQKNLSLTTADDPKKMAVLPPVYADPDRTKQVLYNLVGNAAKFTEQGGITIAAEHNDNFLKIRITDTGRGISLEAQQLLFRKFQQAGSSLLTRDTSKGTGLGLYISRLLIKDMGGDIGLEKSAPGQGTTFFFTLPTQAKVASPAAAKADAHTTNIQTGLSDPADAPSPKPSKGRKHLLIFEDEPYVQRMYQRVFDLVKYEVELAANGDQGVARVKAFRPDLILLDIMMPKVNGLEVLHDLKADKDTKDVPVLILTNIGETETIDKAKQLGAAGYLIKSDFTPTQLLEEVKKYLG
jgi:signal transduction histidine kinase/HAMP domain-containing protein